MRREDEVQQPSIDLNQFGSKGDVKVSFASPEHDEERKHRHARENEERKHRHFKEKVLLLAGVGLVAVVFTACLGAIFLGSDVDLRKFAQTVIASIVSGFAGYLVGKPKQES